MSTRLKFLEPSAISDIIELALSDHVAFDSIKRQHGLSPDEIKAVMRGHLKPGSYKAWRKRVRQMRDHRSKYK